MTHSGWPFVDLVLLLPTTNSIHLSFPLRSNNRKPLTMSLSAIAFTPTPRQFPTANFRTANEILFKLQYNKPNKLRRQYYCSRPKPFSPIVMEWQDCMVKMEIDVPVAVAYKVYSDRERIPRWMPLISSVKIVEGKPDLSRWSLKYNAFGHEIEYSWLTRNMQPIPNQKIHWRSLEGLPNRGAVRFFPKGPASCVVELTISFEVPQLLTPFASTLKPSLESLLKGGLERFTEVAKN